MRFRPALFALALALAVAPAARAAESADAEYAAGETAFRQGDNAAAEAHFRKALEARPDDLRALVKLATVVSWSDRLGEAVALYERALRIDPASVEARSGLARTLSWNGDYDRALGIYRTLLAENPDSRDAALGLARTLSWAGRTAEAREIYLQRLAADPADIEARNGLAAALSWDGHLDDALALYDETLTLAPDNKDALAGRARVLQWQGKTRLASEAAAAALRAHPDDREARKVDAAIRDGLRTVVDASVGFVHDTDRNRINTEHAGVAASPSPSLTVGGSLDRLGARGPGASPGLIDESLLSPRASLTYRFDGGLTVSGAAGVDRVDGAATNDHAAGSASAFYRIDDRWSISGSASKGVFAATARSLLADVEIRSLAATAAFNPIPSVGIRVTAESDRFTDENARRLVSGYARWALPLGRPRVGVSWSIREYACDERGTGYFCPNAYLANLGGVDVSDRIGSRFGWNAAVSLGWQVVGIRAGSRDTDTVQGYHAAGSWDFRKGITGEIYGGWTNLALASGSGFASTELGARIRFTLGAPGGANR